MAWVDLRDPDSGKLLLRFDPERDIVEAMVEKRDEMTGRYNRYKVIVDLAPIRAGSKPATVT